MRTGASRLESSRSLPGDDLVPNPKWQESRAITIQAPPREVWPWLVQMGGDRAGWYWWVPLSEYPKYKQFTNYTEEILPQFQLLEVGDALSDGGPSWVFPLLRLLLGKGDTVAHSTMLRAIKERAERCHAARQQAEERREFA